MNNIFCCIQLLQHLNSFEMTKYALIVSRNFNTREMTVVEISNNWTEHCSSKFGDFVKKLH